MKIYPYDDPIWDSAPHAFGIGANKLLAELERDWDEAAADYLFFSALLHQETTYPASYLAIPHLLRIAKGLRGEPRLMTVNLLGGLALAGQLPAHECCGGVSCCADGAWVKTPLGQTAAETFWESLPQIGQLSIDAFKTERNGHFASGLAAVERELDLAVWLTSGENGGFACPACAKDHEWWLLDGAMGVYRNDDIYGSGADWLDDYDDRSFDKANSIARQRAQPAHLSALMARLGPLDPLTEALFRNYRAKVACAQCGWVGEHP